jgi:hypothetical protein
MSVTLPVVNLNGTSAAELRHQYQLAWDAVKGALVAVVLNGPHGRDYLPQGGESYLRARAEHESRCERLRDVLEELEEIVTSCNEQFWARARKDIMVLP